MLVGSQMSGVGSRFWCRDEKSDGLVGVGRVSDIKTLIFVIRDIFAIVALLPLTQNTLSSKDVREYVFLCFFDGLEVQGLPRNDFK